MAVAVERGAEGRAVDRLAEHLPKLVLAPTFVITIVFVYGFILWTTSFVHQVALHAGLQFDGCVPTSGCGPTATGGPR